MGQAIVTVRDKEGSRDAVEVSVEFDPPIPKGATDQELPASALLAIRWVRAAAARPGPDERDFLDDLSQEQEIDE